MIELVGGPTGDLRRVYLEGLLLTLAAVLPALLLMAWWDWSPVTPLLQIAAAILLGVLGWALLLIVLRHPIYQECARLRPSRA